MWTDLRDFLLISDAGWWVGGALIYCGIALGVLYAVRNFGDVQSGPLPRKLAAPPAVAFPALPRHARPDSDTGVVAYIPGATPDQWVAQQRWIDAVDLDAEELGAFTRTEGLRVIDAEVRTEEPGGLLAGLPVWPAAGPVCPTCGGPFGVCQCLTKADLCPLTTQEFEVQAEATPLFDTTVRMASTRDLSAALEKVRQA